MKGGKGRVRASEQTVAECSRGCLMVWCCEPLTLDVIFFFSPSVRGTGTRAPSVALLGIEELGRKGAGGERGGRTAASELPGSCRLFKTEQLPELYDPFKKQNPKKGGGGNV